VVTIVSGETCRLLVTASVAPSSPILVTLMKEALISSETSVLTRATRRNNPEDTILHSHRRENLKSYKFKIICNNCFITTLEERGEEFWGMLLAKGHEIDEEVTNYIHFGKTQRSVCFITFRFLHQSTPPNP
jgi:hypothetical protein